MPIAVPRSSLKRWYTCHKAARPARGWPMRVLISVEEKISLESALGNANDALCQSTVEVVPAVAESLELGNARTTLNVLKPSPPLGRWVPCAPCAALSISKSQALAVQLVVKS